MFRLQKKNKIWEDLYVTFWVMSSGVAIFLFTYIIYYIILLYIGILRSIRFYTLNISIYNNSIWLKSVFHRLSVFIRFAIGPLRRYMIFLQSFYIPIKLFSYTRCIWLYNYIYITEYIFCIDYVILKVVFLDIKKIKIIFVWQWRGFFEAGFTGMVYN